MCALEKQIFVNVDGQQFGPLTDRDLQIWIQETRVLSQTLCWQEGMAQWLPLGQVFPHYFQAAPMPAAPPVPLAPDPAANYQAGGAVEMEIVDSGLFKMPKITLNNSQVVIEAGAMHYMRGPITIDAKLPSMGKFLKAKFTKEKAVRPVYTGTGEVYLEPTFAEYDILNLNQESWVLDRGAFLACETCVEVGMFTNKAVSGLFGGEGLFQTQVSGSGKVLFLSPGPLERIELVNDQLVVDGSFAVARTASLDYSVEKATKGLFSSWTSGEGFVNTFRGSGTVLLAPVPNRYVTLMREFGGIRSMLSSISRRSG
ncbi:MAG: hypothetical protein CSA81_01570 [Acidobacteria bacterium]|nr:MAG: hypothetical protein CSA81_01570 [Acidobacteriota bacterium]